MMNHTMLHFQPDSILRAKLIYRQTCWEPTLSTTESSGLASFLPGFLELFLVGVNLTTIYVYDRRSKPRLEIEIVVIIVMQGKFHIQKFHSTAILKEVHSRAKKDLRE